MNIVLSVKRSCMLCVLAGIIMAAPGGIWAQSEPIAASIDTARFIEDACLSYSTSQTLDASSLLWERIIAHPYLIGKLWEAYEFEPNYLFHRIGFTIRMIDPTGIDCIMTGIGTDDSTRVMLADGRLQDWGLPIAVKGRVLFVLEYGSGSDRTDIRLRVYAESTGSAADIIIKTFSPLLSYLIDRRVSSNLRDAAIIVGELTADPQEVRAKLPAVLHEEFDRFLTFNPSAYQ